MKKITLAITLLAIMAVACKKTEINTVETDAAADSTAVQTETAGTVKPMDSASMMKAWMRYMTPGDAHKNLAMDNGNWSIESTMWMSPDDKNPTNSAMSATSKMILGGRYQEARYTGVMNGDQFEGISTTGYDNASKKIISTWVDNMGTGIMYLSGDYDGTSKTMELKGDVIDPMTGQAKAMRETLTYVDDNTRKMEMFDCTSDGKEYKSMELLMTRKR